MPLVALEGLVILALGSVAVLLLLAWRYQERVVWQPPAPPFAPPRPDPAVRRVDYVAADGQPLLGYLVTPDRRDAPVLLAFHGNAELAADGVPWARAVAARTGWAVLLAEYRGYAGLPGAPTYAGSRIDARAAHRWLRESLGVPAERLAISGYSLGTAVAVELAAETRAPVVVLHAPFTSMAEMARTIAPRWLSAAWRWIGRIHFDTRQRVATLDASVWVAHGDADPVILVRMGRAVHDAARHRGALLIVPGADHTDIETRGGERYWTFLASALASAERRTAHPAWQPFVTGTLAGAARSRQSRE